MGSRANVSKYAALSAYYTADLDRRVDSLPELFTIEGRDWSVSDLENDFIAYYVSNWCAAVTNSLLGVILSEVYSIPRLSPSGLQQLKTDLIYAMNVANTLGIHPHPMLVHVVALVTKLTGDLEYTDDRYDATVQTFVNKAALDVLSECEKGSSSSSSTPLSLLCGLMTKLYRAIAAGHNITL